MYVLALEVDNVRSIERLRWQITPDQAPGWHIVLGDNGAGKSSFLRAVALALVGPEDVYGLRQSADDWLRKGTSAGAIGVMFSRDRDVDYHSGPGRPPNDYAAYFRLERQNGGAGIVFDESARLQGKTAERTVWSPDARGWFASGFGPYRRFTGGETDSERLAEKKPRLARYMSLFDERFALSDAVEWLVTQKFASLSSSRNVFDRVRDFVNQPDFLPHDVKLVDVEPPKRVLFRDGAGLSIPIEELSDGFRSILSLTLELLRHITLAYGEERVNSAPTGVVDLPGVVSG